MKWTVTNIPKIWSPSHAKSLKAMARGATGMSPKIITLWAITRLLQHSENDEHDPDQQQVGALNTNFQRGILCLFLLVLGIKNTNLGNIALYYKILYIHKQISAVRLGTIFHMLLNQTMVIYSRFNIYFKLF